MLTTSYRAEWNVIASRIEGLVRAGDFFIRSKLPNSERNALNDILLPESIEVYNLLVSYNKKHSGCLPKQAKDCLTDFITKFDLKFTENYLGNLLNHRLPHLQTRLTALIAFRSQFEFHLANIEDQIRATTDRALIHLQRLIVVDSEYGKKWIEEFNKREEWCEKLGAVHLLWHGIWAFKANAAGGRTDLVMGTEIDNSSKVEEASFGMVLTEWKRAKIENGGLKKNKRAKIENEVLKKYKEGVKQAKLYTTDVLGGIELNTIRYIIVVTEDLVSKKDPDIDEGGVKYKFFNIAVAPSNPSEAAQK